VTSRGTSTEEVAGGAAVLVDPTDVDDIARGIGDALRDAAQWSAAGRERAATATWATTAAATAAAYREVAR
jgi:glycosyltransferase involved in cell wall biosynthesis